MASTVASEMTAGQPQDGRAARAQRTRTAIADATLSLLEDGVLRPTAPQVSERAGVSLRSVFQHFADMEALYASVADRQIERVMASMKPVRRDGSLEERLLAFVGERSRLHETIAPVRRAALLVQPFSPEIARRLAMVPRRERAELERVFEPELGARPAKSRRELVEAIAVVSSWSAWETLRRDQSLSVAAAKSVTLRMMRALLSERE